MKGFKKLLTVILTLAMVMTMGMTAFAAETTKDVGSGSGSITISKAAEGQEYDLYKLFEYIPSSGTYAIGEYKITTAFTGLRNYSATVDDVTLNASDYISVDSNGYVTWINTDKSNSVTGTDSAAIAKFAKLVNQYIEDKKKDSSPISPISNVTPAVSPDKIADSQNEIVKFTGLDLGYYIVGSSLGALVSLDTTNKDAEVIEKNSMPTSDKTVKEDSTGNYQKQNDDEIGKEVEFKTTIAVKAGGKDYIMHDAMDDGLTLDPKSIVVKDLPRGVTSNTVTSGLTDTVEVESGKYSPCTFEVNFSGTFNSDTTVTVTYKAAINSKAIVRTGEKNTVLLEYGNHAKAAPITTTTYTYDFSIFKYASDATGTKALSGAEFSLFRNKTGDDSYVAFDVTKSAADNTKANAANLISLVQEEKDEVTGANVYHLVKAGEAKAVTSISTPASGKIIIKGLDADVYHMIETTAPKNYNLPRNDFLITVNRGKESVIDGFYTLEFSGNGASKDSTDPTQMKIENTQGALLPSTGGIGTTIFYLIGGIMILGAFVTFIVKRKMTANK